MTFKMEIMLYTNASGPLLILCSGLFSLVALSIEISHWASSIFPKGSELKRAIKHLQSLTYYNSTDQLFRKDCVCTSICSPRDQRCCLVYNLNSNTFSGKSYPYLSLERIFQDKTSFQNPDPLKKHHLH